MKNNSHVKHMNCVYLLTKRPLLLCFILIYDKLGALNSVYDACDWCFHVFMEMQDIIENNTTLAFTSP